MANELAIRNVDDLGRVGKMLAMSGYFQDAKDVAQASVKVMAGLELGFGAFASMTGIYIIKGRPSIGANLMASAVKANPKYDYRVREHSNDVCKIEFFEIIDGKRESIGVSEFTAKDAQIAGVQNMQKYARNMLFARAMSNGIKWYCPDVFAGNTTYVPEELGVEVDGEGVPVSIEELTPKAQTIVEEAQEQIIEGEIVEPINNTPAEEKSAEAQEKPKFDEIEFLKNWTHRAGLPPLSLEEAGTTQGSDKKEYGTKSTKDLFFMLNAIEKKLPTIKDLDTKDTYLFKLSAINEILTARKSAQEQLEKQGA